ncbi:MAG: AMP-binding protein, partial [Actinomycetota bacterium]|nr:AMP-binding protein [Actinomycetota bacterium]
MPDTGDVMQSWVHLFESRAVDAPEVLAITDDRGDHLTYRELLERVERTAGGWAGQGVGDRSVVAVVGRNSTATIVHTIALMRAGALPALINWRL